MKEPKSMGKVFEWKQKELLTHLNLWRDYTIEQFQPWIDKGWMDIHAIEQSSTGNFYFRISISDGPHEICPCHYHSLYFRYDGCVEQLSQLYWFDSGGYFDDFLSKSGNMSFDPEKTYTIRHSIILIKKLLTYYDTMVDMPLPRPK